MGPVLRNMGAHGALTMKPTKLFGTAFGALVFLVAAVVVL